ncbi:hypothetical protein [Helicobacter brantae]|uniref:hypothetical protein n=1 Tax=Helicobacter brantae TaxID=375927 RepID=UPI0014735742|nr:hypothetical protein [Helicobacter brantae]
MKRHNSSTKQELKKLCQDSSVLLGGIGVSNARDMSGIFECVGLFNQSLGN